MDELETRLFTSSSGINHKLWQHLKSKHIYYSSLILTYHTYLDNNRPHEYVYERQKKGERGEKVLHFKPRLQYAVHYYTIFSPPFAGHLLIELDWWWLLCARWRREIKGIMQVPHNGSLLLWSCAHTHTQAMSDTMVLCVWFLLGPGMQGIKIHQEQATVSSPARGQRQVWVRLKQMNHLTPSEGTSQTWNAGFETALSLLLLVLFCTHVCNSRGNRRLCNLFVLLVILLHLSVPVNLKMRLDATLFWASLPNVVHWPVFFNGLLQQHPFDWGKCNQPKEISKKTRESLQN